MVRAQDRVDQIQAEWRRERPEIDVSPIGVIGRLHRIGDRLEERIEIVHRRHGLASGEFDVLAALRRAGKPYERAPGELARHTMVTTGAMTKRLDRLERAGLVSRHRSSADGRGRTIRLTPAGLDVIDAAYVDHLRNEKQLLAALSPRQRADLEKVLRHWLLDLEPGKDSTP